MKKGILCQYYVNRCHLVLLTRHVFVHALVVYIVYSVFLVKE